jgi:hypothetical protein
MIENNLLILQWRFCFHAQNAGKLKKWCHKNDFSICLLVTFGTAQAVSSWKIFTIGFPVYHWKLNCMVRLRMFCSFLVLSLMMGHEALCKYPRITWTAAKLTSSAFHGRSKAT